MGDVDHLSAYRKIPVYVFLENNILRGSQDILFLTLDAPSLFECVRYYMTAMVEALEKKHIVSFSFETRLYSPKEINEIAEQINKKKKERAQQPTPKPVETPKPTNKYTLRLLPSIEDSKT